MSKKEIKSVAEIPGIDRECIDICDVLNTLPGLETTESCCGHYKDKFRVWFDCDDFSTLGLLARVTSRNYSDGNWLVCLENSDMNPLYGFRLESIKVFETEEELSKSIIGLCNSIRYWLKPEFDNYFRRF